MHYGTAQSGSGATKIGFDSNCAWWMGAGSRKFFDTWNRAKINYDDLKDTVLFFGLI